MKSLPKATRRFFEEWGSQGGKKRTKRLSSRRRSFIASRAARIRWGKTAGSMDKMPSVRLQTPAWDDPVYLEEILSEGGIEEWLHLYHLIADHPFGETAAALEKVVTFSHIYGATNLWKGLLSDLRGGSYEEKEE